MQEYEYPLKAEGGMNRDGEAVLWTNPDVPPVGRILNNKVNFNCPYPDCQDEIHIEGFEERSQLEELLDKNSGTFRCGECNEPLYGFYGNGDQS